MSSQMIDRDRLLDRLAAFEPTTLPVISLYLNTSADLHGRDYSASFLRKELKAAGKTACSSRNAPLAATTKATLPTTVATIPARR